MILFTFQVIPIVFILSILFGSSIKTVKLRLKTLYDTVNRERVKQRFSLKQHLFKNVLLLSFRPLTRPNPVRTNNG